MGLRAGERLFGRLPRTPSALFWELRKAKHQFAQNQRHARLCKIALASLARAGRTLSPQDRKRCIEYARQELGSTVYAPWIMIYSAFSGGFKEGWIADNYYEDFVVPRRNILIAPLGSRLVCGKLIGADAGLPDIGFSANGIFMRRNGDVVSKRDLLQELFQDHQKIVFKQDRSSRGAGVEIWHADKLEQYLARDIPNGSFQYFVGQHPDFDMLSPDGTATLRLTSSVGLDGQIGLRGSYLRLGRKGDTYLRAASNIRVALDKSTGIAKGDGYLPDWQRLDRHPDTGAAFKGFIIPAYQSAVEHVCRLHARFPAICTIGWDIAIDATAQPVCLEWNAGANDIKFSEASQGPNFRDLGWERLWQGGAQPMSWVG